MAGYASIPQGERERVIPAKAGTGGVTEYRFGAYVGGTTKTVTTATSGAYNVGIIAETAAAAAMSSVKMEGSFLLYVDATTAISAGDPLKPTTGGAGIKAATTDDIYNAIALEAKASGTGHIEVRLATGEIN